MVRADTIAPSSEENSCHDRRDIDALHNDKQRIAAKYAVGQKQQASN
jgi:hypothetical protein